MGAIEKGLILYGLVFAHMSLYWLWYLRTRNPGVVDVGWASVIVLIGATSLVMRFGTKLPLLPFFLLVVWGLRLGAYLWYTRVRPSIIEKRYLNLSLDWKQSPVLGFFLHYQLQGILAVLVACPWFFTGLNRPIWLNAVSTTLVLVGILGETLADWQLYRFRNSPNSAEVCQLGLWQYSRHPNYFFDWLSWLGFASFALNEPWGAFALLSPLTLYIIMTRMTAPITEQNSIASRGEAYLAYQKQTPMFFPKIRKSFGA